MNPTFALRATLWIALGGALGSVARFWLAIGVALFAGEAFPWGILIVNVLGSFVIGYFAMLTMPEGTRPASIEMRLFVLVGICGGFTTFSSFSLQTIELLRAGDIGRAAVNIVASVALCAAATAWGIVLARPPAPRRSGR